MVEQGLEFWWNLAEEGKHCSDAATQEECEPHKAGSSDCQEDPNYDQQYPGCPHMGPCPHSGCCPFSGKCPEFRHPEPSVEEKALPNATGGTEEQSIPVEPRSPKRSPSAKRPGRRDIDTTEFRPSDGKPIDFGSIPY
jgi:hypothetical protein